MKIFDYSIIQLVRTALYTEVEVFKSEYRVRCLSEINNES